MFRVFAFSWLIVAAEPHTRSAPPPRRRSAIRPAPPSESSRARPPPSTIDHGSPAPSPPTRMATGPRKSTSNTDRPVTRYGGDNTAAVAPRVGEGARRVQPEPTIGSRSVLPIDPRRAFQPNGSARAPAATRPSAPPASATLAIDAEIPRILNLDRDDNARCRSCEQRVFPDRRAFGQSRDRARDLPD